MQLENSNWIRNGVRPSVLTNLMEDYW